MVVWLIDFDGKIEHLALMRLSAYHKRLGHTVRLRLGDARPELFEMPDRVYISCLFRWNRDAALALADAWGGRAVVGGSGVDVESHLPPAIEGSYSNYAQPDYALYNSSRALGFISRGCPNRCPWCIVPKKEGRLRRVSTASEIVGDRDVAIFLDNNFLALPDFHLDLEWLAAHRVACDFNQGLDARLIDASVAKLLASCNLRIPGKKRIRLACDNAAQIRAVERAVRFLDSAGIPPREVFVYCLIGFAGLESDAERLLFIHDLGATVFPMGYRNVDTGEEPAKGWDRALYRKYRRLLVRLPFIESIWDAFQKEVCPWTL